MRRRASRSRPSLCSMLLWGLLGVSGNGCLGGFTGDAGMSDGASSGAPSCDPIPLAYSQEGRWGVSAAALVEGWGGAREGTLAVADTAFAPALGLGGASPPPSLQLGISYAGGSIQEDGCTGALVVTVAVFVAFGDQGPLWEGVGILSYADGSSSLRAPLLDESGEDALGLLLELSPVAAPANAVLTATGTEPASSATYSFE